MILQKGFLLVRYTSRQYYMHASVTCEGVKSILTLFIQILQRISFPLFQTLRPSLLFLSLSSHEKYIRQYLNLERLVYRQTNRGIKVEIIIEAMTLSFSFDECQLFGEEIAIDRISWNSEKILVFSNFARNQLPRNVLTQIKFTMKLV